MSCAYECSTSKVTHSIGGYMLMTSSSDDAMAIQPRSLLKKRTLHQYPPSAVTIQFLLINFHNLDTLSLFAHYIVSWIMLSLVRKSGALRRFLQANGISRGFTSTSTLSSDVLDMCDTFSRRHCTYIHCNISYAILLLASLYLILICLLNDSFQWVHLQRMPSRCLKLSALIVLKP